MNWLYSLPDTAILALSIVTASLAVIFLPFFVRRLPNFKITPQTSEFALRTLAPLFGMTGLLLAFTLVQAQTNFRIADNLVAAEASQITRLDGLLTEYGDKNAAKLQVDLRTYASAIVDDEWPRMLRDERSEKADRALRVLSAGIFSLEPLPGRQSTVHVSIVRAFEGLQISHDARLNTATLALPSTYWYVLLLSVLALLLITSTIDRTRFRTVMLTTQMAIIGAFFGFVFIMDQPFRGQHATDTKPIVLAIKKIDSHRD